MATQVYKLVCSPNSQGIEDEVNKIIRDNPKAKFTFFAPVCGPYFNRRVEVDCIECGGEVIETTLGLICSSCKRLHTSEEARQLAKTKFTQAGTLFLQPLIIENEVD